ncbi:hypothetical protein A2955_03865 [Candidatus Woesebacteria bacterium RIFCSPLOWO2_01_FULL_37_19]|uniref:Uncharacterized protein n=1 Tax=Candidatus Woesebacteria bacterium RIFCSPLOWO2_01_FULL_37_19 TaxID=1802514 RepID=A0A1F8B6M6_9BACT|nr:MAG: hypothetical protein A2955_03865 [Candidatus Woesebacteria bacterium RIFCSPLOWO2_01_FULL_37_19]
MAERQNNSEQIRQVRQAILDSLSSLASEILSPRELEKREEESEALFEFLNNQELLQALVKKSDMVTPHFALLDRPRDDRGNDHPRETLILIIKENEKGLTSYLRARINLVAEYKDMIKFYGDSSEDIARSFFQEGWGGDYSISEVTEESLVYYALGSRALGKHSLAVAHGSAIAEIYESILQILTPASEEK